MRLCANNCGAGLLMDCCSWVVNQDGVCFEVYWTLALCEGGPGCRWLEQEPDGLRASMEAGWDTFNR